MTVKNSCLTDKMMKVELKKIFLTGLLIFLLKGNFYSQLTVTSNTACPNQPVTLNATWPNVGQVTYTVSKSSTAFTIQASSTFTVSDAGPAAVVYTISAQGTALSGPVTSTATATLTIVPPTPIVVTTNSLNYCYGANVTFSAELGSSTNYSITGPPGALPSSNSNLITVTNVTSPAYTGVYVITGNYGGCIRTGTAQINVSPNSQIVISTPTNVCQGAAVSLAATLSSVANTGFSWSGPANATGANPQISPAIPYTLTGVYTAAANFSFNPSPANPNSNTALCPRTATTSITVVQTSTITVTPPSTVLCQGGSLSMAASVSISPTPGFSWVGPQQFVSSLANPVIGNLTPANSGDYTVTALFYNTAVSCPSTAVVHVTVVAVADPIPSGPSNVCQNTTATLSVSAPGANSFLWYGPNNFTSTAQSPTISNNIQVAASGPYYITANYGSVPCPRTKSITINVVPVNTITVIAPADVCLPDNALFQSTSIGATSFTWSGPHGNIGYLPNITLYHPSLAESGIYTITMGYNGGALTCLNSTTVSLTVKPLLNFTLSPAQQLVCYNTDIHLAGPPGATSYSWTSTGGFVSSTQNFDLPAVQQNASGNYYLAVSLDGCITTGTTSLEVLSPIAFSQPFFERNICRGDTVYLESPTVGGSENYAYMWNPGIYLSSITGSAVVGIPEGTTTYNVRAHDIICPDYVISGTIKVTVNQPPVSQLELQTTEACAPLTQHYDTKTYGESAWVTYDFGPHLKYQQDNFVIPLNDPGIYTLNVSLTGTNGCTGTYTYPQPIIVHPKPSLSIITDPESPTINDDVIFAAATDYSVSSFSWIFSNPNVPEESDTTKLLNPLKSFENAGSYRVFVTGTTDYGCADTTVRFINIREDFNVFIPNSFTPNGDNVNDVFKIKSTGLDADHFTMELINRKGKVLFSTKDLNEGWDGTTNGVKVEQDVYVYKITVVGGHSEGKKQYLGQFSLLR